LFSQEHNTNLEQYSNMVEETIDLDELAHHNFVLQAAFDPALEDIKTRLIGVMDGLDEEHDNVASATGIDKEKKLHLEKHHVYGYSLRVTKAASIFLSRQCATANVRTHRRSPRSKEKGTSIWLLKSLGQSLPRGNSSR
jgi:DNA mismatch repair ATPase MutS